MSEESVGDRLARIRRYLSVILDRDLRQDEIAELTGFSPAVWSHWETGRRRPSRDTVAQIVAKLEPYGIPWLTIPYLDYGEGDGPPAIGKRPPIRLTKPREQLHKSVGAARKRKGRG